MFRPRINNEILQCKEEGEKMSVSLSFDVQVIVGIVKLSIEILVLV